MAHWEARNAPQDVREVFEAIGVAREALAALLLAKEAVAGGCATAEIVRRVVAVLGDGGRKAGPAS